MDSKSLSIGNKIENNDSANVAVGDDHSVEINGIKDSISTRLRVDNLPPFYGMKQVRKFLKDHLNGIEYQRLKTMPRVAIFSLDSEEHVKKVIKILSGFQLKKNELSVKRVGNDPALVGTSRQRKSDDAFKAKCISTVDSTQDDLGSTLPAVISAAELVTPLASMPYTEQLARKQQLSRDILSNVLRQIARAGIPQTRKWLECLKPILPSPSVTGYRNKCEFCVARSADTGQITVGFVQGRMAERELRVADAQSCTNLTRNTINIVRHFQQFVRNFDSQLDAFDEFQRTGFWKMLTVRDFHGDCMLVVTAHPYPDEELVRKVKTALVDAFIRFGTTRGKIDFRVTSLYWQTIENASDAKVYEHLAGAPYIYETILGERFQISPSTFFQTNSRGAEVLYTQIGDALGLPSLDAGDAARVAVEQEIADNEAQLNDDHKHIVTIDEGSSTTDGVESNISNLLSDEKIDNCYNNNKNTKDAENEMSRAKRLRTEENLNPPPSAINNKSTVLLDICCGAGTIGICLMKRMKDLVRLRKFTESFGCVGIELIPEAIRDANINAANNGFTTKNCRYLTGQAENIFAELNHYMPENCKSDSVELLGVLDPPRAGVSDKVVIGCRKLERMKHLVYVSCDPRAATKNLTDLCRPRSNKYEGTPFGIVSVQPVDMFPQTEHFEWVVALQRS